jgi:D-glycero-D-manno-heptose 1,7-bisphosphate phosphatase
MNRACFFDLDGTLVRALPEGDTTRGPRTVEEVDCLPDAAKSLRAIQRAGYWVIVVTNQPGIARGTVDPSEHGLVRMLVRQTFPGLLMYCCPHDGQWCACRKPRPGLIWQAAVEHELDLAQCWLVGDREHDREAGLAAGIPPDHVILIKTNQGIEEATRWILEHSR